ncbi:hypothetical protein H2200_011548 [Cladophialophora chaetospira]|uniref:DUF7223 domain-containing protein n=1 Tax=Cladophialophora chaetospira TaxID=386627 RepID=A0AA39CD83_9EURO|nr:hypothetical protein H2200_011548 [Cladophialophora chaetospira]
MTPTALKERLGRRDVHPKDPRRRQASPTTASLSLTLTSPLSSIPAATATSLSIDLAHGVDDTWFPLNAITNDANPLPINIGCKNCSTSGTFNLEQGEWSFDLDNLFDANTLTDIINGGYVQLSFANFVAHVEIEIEPSLQGDISLPLFSIPVAGFTIPEIGSGGLFVEPMLTLSWALTGGIEMSYGFELKIPDLKVLLDFANLNASSVSGLDTVSLTDVPFQANVSDLELSLRLALAPRITLGLQLLENLITAEVGTSFDLPKTTVTITQLATDAVDATCDKSNGEDVVPAFQSNFEDLFQNLTHIATQVELGIGLVVQAGISALPRLDLSSSIELASLPVAALPTQCLAFQTQATGLPGFTPAASALKAVQASASTSSSASAAAARSSEAASNGRGMDNSASGWRHSGVAARNSLCAIVVVMGLSLL